MTSKNISVPSKKGIALKIYAIVLLATIGISATTFLSLRNSWHDLLDTKRNELSHLVQSAVSVVSAFDKKVGEGTISLKEAQTQAKATIASMHYDGKQYFWINDMQPSMIMHPVKPALNGKDMSQFKDPNGLRLFVEFVNKVQEKGKGFVQYMWAKPGYKDPQPKLSYVSGYTSWGWIIGTGVYIDDLNIMFWANTRQMLITAFSILAAMIVLSVFLARSITQPLSLMTQTMKKLADGQLDIDVPAKDRTDEIGEMSKAVDVFRNNAKRNKQMEREQEEQKHHTEQEKQAVMIQMADDFDINVGGIVETVSSASAELQATAQSMAGISEQTSHQAAQASIASQETSANVQSVATATEEMTSTIGEISQQVAQASGASRLAVEEVGNTSQQMVALAETANKIGQVVELISGIAEQTNLLALNATIESARAGEAGKGFAVVAGEVKQLANQTAKATNEISQQINDIQNATKQASGSMENVADAIGKVDEISTAIAAAMEEQSAATQEIANSVHQAAAGTEQVNDNISSVTQASQEAGTASGEVMSAAGELSQQAELLKGEMSKFIAQVRTG